MIGEDERFEKEARNFDRRCATLSTRGICPVSVLAQGDPRNSMIKIFLGIGLFGLLTSSAFTGLVIAGIWRFLARRRAAKQVFLPPVTLFKPLHGAEPNLEAHLETFFQQDYPAYEIIFGARVSSDPGMQAARRVAQRYPRVPVKFVLTGEPWHVNAKVSTLELMERSAAHDIFIVSDSDVRVSPDYIREVVMPFADAKSGRRHVPLSRALPIAASGRSWRRPACRSK